MNFSMNSLNSLASFNTHLHNQFRWEVLKLTGICTKSSGKPALTRIGLPGYHSHH
jgi:hypothetical protein